MLFIGGGSRFAVGLTLRPIVDDLGWGRSELGLAVALFQVVSAAAMFGAGYLAAEGQDFTANLLFLWGFGLFLLPVYCVAAASCIRAAN